MAGQNLSDIEELSEGVDTDNPRLTEQCVDCALGIGRLAEPGGDLPTALDGDDRLAAPKPPRQPGELAGIAE